MTWQPFYRVDPVPPTKEQVQWTANALGVSEVEALQWMAEEGKADYYRNNIYLVQVRKVQNSAVAEHGYMYHLSIRRNDRRLVRDWRHLQRIKNELLGPDYEAVELFPSEDRRVDYADQWHLWALPTPEMRFPVGYQQGMDSEAQERIQKLGDMPGSTQRPRKEP
jgi:hypothetical protein